MDAQPSSVQTRFQKDSGCVDNTGRYCGAKTGLKSRKHSIKWAF